MNFTPENAEIQIWENSGDGLYCQVAIRIENNAEPLPTKLEEKVVETWKSASEGKPNMQNNPVLFLSKEPEDEYLELERGRIITTNIRPFQYVQAFNRTKEFHSLTNELNQYKLLHLSTHAHLVTSDGMLLFGTKKNQFNQISGFSGFPNAKEDIETQANGSYLDIPKMLRNRLAPEIGSLVNALGEGYANIHTLGITYVGTEGLRGTDLDLLVKLNATSQEARDAFKESFQFSKELHVVPFEPSEIRKFIKNIHAEGKKMSKYALGCQYLVAHEKFGEIAAVKYLETIRDLGITIATTNQTDYFK